MSQPNAAAQYARRHAPQLAYELQQRQTRHAQPGPAMQGLCALVDAARGASRYQTAEALALDAIRDDYLRVMNKRPADLDAARRGAACDAVAEALVGSYDCGRAWEAWSYGTMGPGDFHELADNADRIAEIANAAIDTYLAANART